MALTRLFSVALFYHFAFLAVSLAMLGLGAGGVFAYLKRDWLVRWNLRQLASLVCVLNAVAVIVALGVVLHVPVSLALEPMNFLRLTTIYLAAGVPFFFTGLLLSLVFARASRWVTQLYGADLIGGALGCLAVVPLLNLLGGPNAVLCASLAMAVAGGIWASTGQQRRIAIGLAAVLLVLVVVNHSERLIDVVYAKGARSAQAWVEFTRWNAISRVEVDDLDKADSKDKGKWIRIDADAGTKIMNADPHDPTVFSDVRGLGESWDIRNVGIANVLRPHGDYAIIGPGGGIDVLRALAAGSTNVTGIEINPIIATTIMRGRYADYAHHLYELPEVHIHVNDGRSWIRSSRDGYDVIQMTLVDTWASTAAGAFALSENNLYTIEAFREYFDHLKPGGLIAITRWEFIRPREALRVVAQEIEVLRMMGVRDVRRNFIIAAEGQLNEDGQPVTVLAKKTPFTVEEERAVLSHLRVARSLYLVYLPYTFVPADEPNAVCEAAVPPDAADCIGADLVHLSDQRRAVKEAALPFGHLINYSSNSDDVRTGVLSTREEFIQSYPFNIAPATDDKPFFFFTLKTGNAVRTLLMHRWGVDWKDWKNNLGLVVLGVLLIVSIAAVLAFLVVPLALHRQARKQPLPPLLYFVAIGLGYILAEIALIQRFVLFLGHPTYALTVVIFLMLLSSGTGSLLSRRWLGETQRVRRVLALIISVVAVYIFLLHRLLGSLVALPIPGKLLISGVLLAPLGFLMGMPFPTGLRVLASESSPGEVSLGQQFPEPANADSSIEWAWAMNAASSVLGSVLAMTVAIHFGLNATLACAAGAYLTATGLTLLWQRT